MIALLSASNCILTQCGQRRPLYGLFPRNHRQSRSAESMVSESSPKTSDSQLHRLRTSTSRATVTTHHQPHKNTSVGNSTHALALMMLTVILIFYLPVYIHVLSAVSSLYTRNLSSSISIFPDPYSRQHAQLNTERHIPILTLLGLQCWSNVWWTASRLLD
jgi:hypothetical protein